MDDNGRAFQSTISHEQFGESLKLAMDQVRAGDPNAAFLTIIRQTDPERPNDIVSSISLGGNLGSIVEGVMFHYLRTGRPNECQQFLNNLKVLTDECQQYLNTYIRHSTANN